MKKHVFKYIIEFLVVVTGIIISINIEKNRALDYKNELKDQSLRRLAVNIQQDISDSKINRDIYLKGLNACSRVLNSSQELFKYDKDSLGYYLNAIYISGTIFVDNQEEYLTLRNSGFLELIESDSLVTAIQNKYSYHEFYKEVESFIRNINDELTNIVDKKVSYRSAGKGAIIGNFGTYIHKTGLSNKELNVIKRKQEILQYYIPMIKNSIKSDSILIEQIQNEII
ncbi:MAG: hypothetical protein CMD25_01850 [Flavobacteriales bacterium]|nr:hypothetical protein [Flavobacteriales bacterium]|tara:strand:+ start:1938 stop:2618 length:681 start_codon:yes stop_codon:yes gene_type:complete